MPRSGRPIFPASLAAAAVLLLALLPTPAAHAAVERTWTGLGNDALWSNPLNWATGVPDSGDSVRFPPGAARTDSVHDLEDGLTLSSITFDGQGYRVTGNRVTLTGPVGATAEGTTNTLGTPLTLKGGARVSAVARAVLEIAAGVDTAGAPLLDESDGRVVVRGVVSGS